jgi:AraC-like DNA-binding protein
MSGPANGSATGKGAEFRAHPDLGLEHIAATFSGHRFPAHAHDSTLIGLTLAGAEEIVQSGKTWLSRPGQVRFINAWEVHEGGAPVGLAWSYEALYVPDAAMTEALGIPPDEALPRFSVAVAEDGRLAAALRRLFETLRHSQEQLDRQSRFAAFAAGPLAPHLGVANRKLPPADPPAVRRARSFLADHALGKISLDRLSAEAGQSKFHLLRTFKAATGFTPWQYQVHLRIEHAKRLLRVGEPASQVANACGFVDQSHFTRIFKSLIGVTPAVYAASHRRLVHVPARTRPQHDTRRAAPIRPARAVEPAGKDQADRGKHRP